MSTPTPRTDRAWNVNGGDNAEAAWAFARTLERELATERKKVKTLHKALGDVKNSICRNVPDGYSQPCVDESADECDRIIDAAIKEGA